MPRPRTFDEDRAVDAATRAFWARGYEATSTDDLCRATGLGRSSLYNTFTDKRTLYDAALARYIEQRTSAALAILDGEGTAREKLEEILAAVVDPDPDDPAGCFVVNAFVELSTEQADTVAGRALRRDRERRLDAFAHVIEAGRRDGSITSIRPAADLAEFVSATISGIRVAARAGVDAATQAAIARAALDAL